MKLELVMNLKTGKALGLTIPATFLWKRNKKVAVHPCPEHL
jgi:hypothetical protein